MLMSPATDISQGFIFTFSVQILLFSHTHKYTHTPFPHLFPFWFSSRGCPLQWQTSPWAVLCDHRLCGKNCFGLACLHACQRPQSLGAWKHSLNQHGTQRLSTHLNKTFNDLHFPHSISGVDDILHLTRNVLNRSTLNEKFPSNRDDAEKLHLHYK